MENPKENKNPRWLELFNKKIQDADETLAEIEKLKKELRTETDIQKNSILQRQLLDFQEKLKILTDEIKNLIFKGIISVVCMLCLSAFTAVSLTALYYQPKINDLNETRDKLEPEIQNK